MDVSKLCTPAFIYFFLAVISIVIAIFNNVRAITILIKIVFVLVWTWFLNYLCKKGYSVISWVLVILPFLMMIGMISIVFEVANKPSRRFEGFQEALGPLNEYGR
jgi:hypothetical protein